MTNETNDPALSLYVVEDSDLMLGLLKRVLQSELGVRVLGHSADADAAIEEILVMRPEVIVVDLSLRRGTGYDVLRVVTKMTPSPTCLVLTNHSTAPYKEAADRLGVSPDHFFDKTGQVPEMVTCVRELARSRSTTLDSGEGSDGLDHEQGDRRRSVQGTGRTYYPELRHGVPPRRST
jgi:DNA-binding NarL/FixJ family response regulator